jgi:hypothetical protein
VDPGAARRRPPRRHPLPPAERQGHAHACTDRDDQNGARAGTAWLAQYLAELTAFPNGKHDDQVDSTAQMLDRFKGTAREPGRLYGYYRALAKELPDPQAVKPAPLSARASAGGDTGRGCVSLVSNQ